MSDTYWAANGPMPTTAAFAYVATGTAIKTQLQIAMPSTRTMRVKAWGISFNASAAATPLQCELLQTDVAATVTAHVAAGVQPYNNSNAPPSLVTLGTSATGYNASAEGTITATRHADLQFIPPTNQYSYDWPLDEEFEVAASKFLRVRVLAAVTVNCYCWVRWKE
jgi:hypothetical protein